MCTFPSVPPALSFFWPWQAPVDWLLFGVFYAVIVVPLAVSYRALVRRSVPSRQRELVIGFAFAGCALALVSLALLLTVVEPSFAALLGWLDTQLPWAMAHQCTNDLSATFHLVASAYLSLEGILWVSLFMGWIIGGIALATPSIQHRFVRLRRWLDARRVAP